METISIKNNILVNPLELDNAAKLYPFIDPKKKLSLFSLNITMKNNINYTILYEALMQTLQKFPTFNMKLKRGFFWYYFISNDKKPVIIKGDVTEQMFIDKKENNEFLFKIIYNKNKMSLIIFHALTDGAGAMVFLKSLLNDYIKLSGKQVFVTESIPFTKDRTEHISECEDNFKKHYKEWKKGLAAKTKAYHYKGIREENIKINVTTGSFKVSELLKETKAHQVSVTIYLTALYMYVLQTLQCSEKKKFLRPIRIQVPVNLRSIYPSKTLRNFSSYVVPELKANQGELTFEEILEETHNFFKLELNKRKLTAQFSDNVRMENHPIVKRLPVFIKKPIMLYVSYQLGDRCQSGTLSNLGKIKLPDYIEDYVLAFEPVIGVKKYISNNCALASYKDEMHISFSRNIKETTLENLFFSELLKRGINVKLALY